MAEGSARPGVPATRTTARAPNIRYLSREGILPPLPKAAASPADRRRFTRVAARMAAIVKAGRRHYDAVVIDLSLNGLQLSIDGEAPSEAVEAVIVPELGMRSPVRMMWRTSDRMGLRFAQPPFEIMGRLPLALKVELSAS